MAQRCQNSTKQPRVCHRCRARSAKGGMTSSANAKPTIPVSKAKPTPASPILTGSGRKKPWSSPQQRTPRQSLQLQEMASTCEDAVRRIDQLSAATQQLLKELGLSSVGGVGRSPSRTRPNPFSDMCPVPTRAFVAGAAQGGQEPTAPVPCLPTFSQPAAARNVVQPSQVSIREPATAHCPHMFSPPSVAFQRLEQSLASYVPSPLSAGRVILACGRCLDLRELWPAFASNMDANTAQRERIAEGLASRQISQELLNVYRRFDPTASELTWSHGRLRDFVKACFAELAVVSPTDSQIYMVYTHFDPELMMKLTALESISLVEVLLRASLGPEPMPADEPEHGFDHPTFLAEQWVSQYVPLPVDGTISIAYSTGVVIHFPDFSEMLQSLASLNKPQRGNILYRIASCDLLRHALQVFKHCEDGTGYLAWSDRQIEGFVTEVFVQEGLVPPTAQQVAAFYDKFAELQPRLNASECLCLVDALFRALLHAGTDRQRPTDPAGHPHVEGFVAEEPTSGSPDPGTERESLATAALFTGDVREQEPRTAQGEPKPIAAARAWVASVAHGLPFLEPLSGSHLSSAERFAELALQVYLEQPSAMQGKLFYTGERQNEMESFLSALFHRASLSLSNGPGLHGHGLHPPPSSLVSTVAEQIDLQGSGFLDVTQCLLLSDGLMRLAEKPGEDKLGPGKHRKGGATGPLCAVSVAGAASPVLDERTPQGIRQHAPPVDQETLQQVASKAFMTCDESGHGYLTWSEVRSFISMIFRGLGLVNHLTESDIYKLYARFDEEHTARLGMDQCLRLARAAVPQSLP
ncbi:SUMF2 [Symbiodinium sp. CCMP2456]|nr:SUMF2 [Symbiodinium sp. CCMP2456]